MKLKSTLAFICTLFLLMSSFTACSKSSSDVHINSDILSQAIVSVHTDSVNTTSLQEQSTDSSLRNGLTYSSAGDVCYVTDMGNFDGTSIVIPDNCNNLPVVAIKNSAFESCTFITDVTLGNNITEIGERAFACCSSLTTVVLPEGVETIRNMAFENSGITSIIIPSTVKKLGNNCFTGCRNLQAIYFNGTMAEWKAIKKGNMMYLECGTTGAICTDGKISY